MMKKTLLAVFGHYDSRGGTSAIMIKEPSMAEVKRACDAYNEDFGWNDTLADYKRWKALPPEEKAATIFNWGWDPTATEGPAADDFLFVAELHYEDELPDGDIEDDGVVLCDESTTPDFGALPERDMDGSFYHGVWSLKHQIEIALQRLTQLEFVRTPGGGRYGWDNQTMPDSMTPEQADAWNAERDGGLLGYVNERAKVVKGTTDLRSWNDDAFGFVILDRY